jgi:hypothetical protein
MEVMEFRLRVASAQPNPQAKGPLIFGCLYNCLFSGLYLKLQSISGFRVRHPKTEDPPCHGAKRLNMKLMFVAVISQCRVHKI